MDNSSQISSPNSVDSSSNSKFKTLKKKIRNKFRLSRTEEVKTISQAVEILRKSEEVLSLPNDNNSELLKNEFKELKETLESILNQNQTLAEVVKTVDSSCPDPFNDPEKFSVYFAQKTLSSRSVSDEFDNLNTETSELSAKNEVAIAETSMDIDNPLVRLQNLRMEEQRGFQIERENYETRLGQLSLLQQEIEMLRKQNSEHEIQLEFLKSQKSSVICNESNSEIEELRNQFSVARENHLIEISVIKSEMNQSNEAKDAEICKLNESIATLKNEIVLLKSEIANNSNVSVMETSTFGIEDLKQTNSQLHEQLEETLSQLKALQETFEGQEEKERQFREISEENVRIKIEFNELQKELTETKTQLADLEKEPMPVASIPLENKEKNDDDESAFKYVYLSNLVLKFMQFPEQRPELSQIILTTLRTDQPYFQKIMGHNK